MGRGPEALFETIRHAGAIFLGAYCPEAVGDYVGGPNHVLPTGRTARFASGLSVFDFLKRTTWMSGDQAALRRMAGGVTLAEAEGLGAHARIGCDATGLTAAFELYSDRQQCNAGHPKPSPCTTFPDEVSTSRYPTLISCEGQCPLTD